MQSADFGWLVGGPSLLYDLLVIVSLVIANLKETNFTFGNLLRSGLDKSRCN